MGVRALDFENELAARPKTFKPSDFEAELGNMGGQPDRSLNLNMLPAHTNRAEPGIGNQLLNTAKAAGDYLGNVFTPRPEVEDVLSQLAMLKYSPAHKGLLEPISKEEQMTGETGRTLINAGRGLGRLVTGFPGFMYDVASHPQQLLPVGQEGIRVPPILETIVDPAAKLAAGLYTQNEGGAIAEKAGEYIESAKTDPIGLAMPFMLAFGLRNKPGAVFEKVKSRFEKANELSPDLAETITPAEDAAQPKAQAQPEVVIPETPTARELSTLAETNPYLAEVINQVFGIKKKEGPPAGDISQAPDLAGVIEPMPKAEVTIKPEIVTEKIYQPRKPYPESDIGKITHYADVGKYSFVKNEDGYWFKELRRAGGNDEYVLVTKHKVILAKKQIKVEPRLTGTSQAPDLAEVIEPTPGVREAPKTKPPAKYKASSDVVQVPIKDIKADVDRFQNRSTEYSPETVKRIIENYQPDKFDPIQLWKDPKDNQIYVVSGHSRLEAARQLGLRDAKAVFIKGDETAAIKRGIIEGNRGQTKETLGESVRAYTLALKNEYPKSELKNLFGSDLNTLESVRHLDPGSKFLKALDIPASQLTDQPFVRRFATWAGDAREKYGDKLTRRHEDQLFDFIYGKEKNATMPKDEFFNLIAQNVDRVDWNPNQPLVLKRGQTPLTGTKARPDTGWIEKRIDELRDLKKEAANFVDEKAIDAEISKLASGIAEIVKKQTDIFAQKEAGLSESEVLYRQPQGKRPAGPGQTDFFNKLDKETIERALRQRIFKPEEVKRVQSEVEPPPVLKNQATLFRKSKIEEPSPYEGGGGVPLSMERASGKVQDVPSIIRNMEKDFGIPIRIGKFGAGKKKLGVYKVREEVARLKEANDLATASHEVAHHINKKYQITQKIENYPALIKEIKNLDYEAARGMLDEGFAEYLRLWLTDDSAPLMAPKFTKAFDSLLAKNPKLAESLNRAKADITRFRKQGTEARVEAWLGGGKQKIDLADKETYKNFGMEARRMIDDQLQPLRYMEREIEGKLGRKLRGAESPYQTATAIKKKAQRKAENWVEFGTQDFDGNITGPGLADAFKSVVGKEKEAIEYAATKHAIERWQYKKNPGISLADARYYVDKHKSPVLDKFSQDLTSYRNRLLDYVVDSGEFDPATANLFREMYESAIPFYREGFKTPTEMGGKGRGYFDLPSPYKEAVYSGRRVINPLAGLIMETERLIGWADRARIGGLIIEAAQKAEGMGRWVEKVDLGGAPIKISVEEVAQKLEKLTGESIKLTPEQQFNEFITFWTAKNRGIPQENIVIRYHQGSVEAYQLHPELYKAVKSLDKMVLPWFLKMFTVPKKIAVAGATGWRASFGLVTNAIRDPVTYFMQSKDQYANPLKAIRGNYKVAREKLGLPVDAQTELYFRQGGELANLINAELPSAMRTARRIIKDNRHSARLNIVRHPVDLFRNIINLPESGPRVEEFKATYDRVLKETHDPRSAWIEAMYDAQEVTLNFTKSGYLSEIANQFIPFFNPSVQGISKMVRTIKDQPAKTFARGAALTAATLLLWNQNKDEQWYKALPAWDKYGFFHFKFTKNGPIVRIPRPFEWGYIFGAIPEASADWAYTKNPKEFISALEQSFNQSLPPVMPAAVGPGIEAGIGKQGYDFFRSNPIVPASEVENEKPENRFGPHTSETAKAIGGALGVSPRKVEHVIGGYTGGMGMDAIQMAESVTGIKKTNPGIDKLAKIPFVNRLISRTPYVSNFYDALESAKDKALKTDNSKDLGEAKRLTKYAAQISLIRKAMNKAEDPDKKIKFEKMMNDIARKAIFGSEYDAMARAVLSGDRERYDELYGNFIAEGNVFDNAKYNQALERVRRKKK